MVVEDVPFSGSQLRADFQRNCPGSAGCVPVSESVVFGLQYRGVTRKIKNVYPKGRSLSICCKDSSIL